MDEMGLQILNESDINSTESAKYESREPLEKLETTNLRGVPRTLATKTSTIIRNIGINRLRTGALVEKADRIINKVDRFINKSLRSTALHSLDLATSSSSGYFSDEFVYATLFLLAILLATLIRFLFKIGIAFMTREGESNLKIAVTADMRQSKYEVLTPDIYLNDHNHSKIRSGVRLRTRTPTSTEELSRKNSTSTNTFLLFSPTIGAE